MTATTSRTYYYARVSSSGQNLARQLEAFAALGADVTDDTQVFTDKQSGKDTNRPGFKKLMRTIRPGDTLVIKSLDRLSRSKADTTEILRQLRENDVRVKVIDLPTTMIEYPAGQAWVLDMVTNILIEVLATIAEQERITIRARQAEGIAAMPVKDGRRVSAKTDRAIGRPALEFPGNWDEVFKAWSAGEISAVEAMKRTGTKKTSFYKLVKASSEA